MNIYMNLFQQRKKDVQDDPCFKPPCSSSFCFSSSKSSSLGSQMRMSSVVVSSVNFKKRAKDEILLVL